MIYIYIYIDGSPITKGIQVIPAFTTFIKSLKISQQKDSCTTTLRLDIFQTIYLLKKYTYESEGM